MSKVPTIPIYQVDAFADRPFAGNPAAVCILEAPMTEGWMQNVAAEMNLAETSFVSETQDGFDLRWFTPSTEVDLCGHATLAAAHVLWETGRLPEDRPALFTTRSGLLTCTRAGDRIEMDFPAEPAAPAEAPAGLLAAIGADASNEAGARHATSSRVEIAYVGRNRFDYLVEVNDPVTLRAITPDFRRLAEISARGVIVTCRSDDPRYDFLSRFFAPAAGIDEDPVTGSAHCCLGPYWQQRLQRSELTGYQASRRGGVVGVRVEGNRVRLLGTAITVLRGELVVYSAAHASQNFSAKGPVGRYGRTVACLAETILPCCK
jgi:PhzF family phenazine biosynthesis protein